MKPQRAQPLRDLWLPVLVGVGGVLIAMSVWGLLVADRRAQILGGASDTADEVGGAIQHGFQAQVDTLTSVADTWQTFGPGSSGEWQLEVGHRIDATAGLESVAWVDFEGARTRIAHGSVRESIELDVEEARKRRDAPYAVGPEYDQSGEIGYRIFVPVRPPDGEAGVLIGYFSVPAFLEDALRARASSYQVRVVWAGREIYSRGEATSDAWQKWWHVERELRLPIVGSWQVSFRPTPEYAAVRLNPLPHYLLAAGIVLSIVLALAAYQLRVILRQSRFLEASNRALDLRREELEGRVEARTRELQAAVAELEAFNYSVSHDLRSPLAAILNFSAILEEDYRDRPLDAEGVRVVSRIHRSAERATALLEDLLQLSRMGRSAITQQKLDMEKLARETFVLVRVSDEDVDVEFLVEDLPEATGDRSLVADVFANLFSNALKYSRGCEKRRITVTGSETADECRYEVADTGRGFDMRFAEKIFGVFERLHTEEGIEGTGVGLAMVARIVERHGGRVSAEGTPGEGARFTFTLPRRTHDE